MPNFSVARKITSFTQKEISILHKSAKRVFSSDFFDIKKGSRSEEATFGRILIVIPKKVGSAPTRNKIRRRIKSIFYQQKMFDLPFDFIIYVKQPAKDLTFQEIKEILDKTLC